MPALASPALRRGSYGRFVIYPMRVDEDGTVWCMARAESDDGQIIGDALLPLRPGDDGYEAAYREVTGRTSPT